MKIKYFKKYYSTNFPYKFNNQTPRINHIKPISFEEDMESYIYVYNQFINALFDKDYTYLENITEVNFFHTLKNCMEQYKKEIFLSNNYMDKKDINTNIVGIEEEFNFGKVTTDRLKNLKLEKFKMDFNSIAKYGRFPKHLEYVNLYKEKGFFKNLSNFSIVVRTMIDVKTNLIISESDKKVQDEIHSFIIEEEIHPYFFKSSKRNMIISDFDNLMSGNPLLPE